MLYYRRKLILALINQAGGYIDKMSLQKLLFLFCSEQMKKCYDFVPYKYGCFSFTANADLTAMVKRGELMENETQWKLNTTEQFKKQLTDNDQKIMKQLSPFFNFSINKLLEYTYKKFPYYAKNSLVVERYLNVKEENKKYSANSNIFTIGYEGISLEQYLNKLIKNQVQVLIDVRKNPLSMKYGFSKKQLAMRCENVGIQYRHFPQVGVEAKSRKNLHTRLDYERLFKQYAKTILKNSKESQKTIAELAEKYRNVALTCFEADYTLCHRNSLSSSVLQFLPKHFKVEHL